MQIVIHLKIVKIKIIVSINSDKSFSFSKINNVYLILYINLASVEF